MDTKNKTATNINREIKFRYYFTNHAPVVLNLSEISNGALHNLLQGNAGFVNHICEFTGLKDKNGKEIYEGDELVEGGDSLIVRFGVPESTQFVDNKSPRFYCELDDGSLWDFEEDDEPIVIGNIYEGNANEH